MKQLLFNFFLKFNIVISGKTPYNTLKQLVDALKAVAIDEELIRIGSEHDGGYLLPDIIDSIDACFSPGVGPHSTFEKSLASRGIDVYLADYSVDNPTLPDDKFHFIKKFIGAINNDTFMTLESFIHQTPYKENKNLLLQMDIEGYEYEVLNQCSTQALQQFKIIVIEFHYMHLLFSYPMFKMMQNAFLKLLQTHLCVHIHPNNCCYSASYNEISTASAMEFTFVRKDSITTSADKQLTFPHPLDSDTTDKPHEPLAPCWYK